MPEEVLLLEYAGPPKPEKKKIRIIVPDDHTASAMIAILERMADEKFAPGTDIVLTIEKEKDRCGGIVIVEGGGVFGHFPARLKFGALETDSRTLARSMAGGRRYAVESDRSMLAQALAGAISVLQGNVIHSPDRRKDNLNAQVNPYVPLGRSAALLRQSARKRHK